MFSENQIEALRDIGGEALVEACGPILPMLGFGSYERLTATKKTSQMIRELESFATRIERLSPDALEGLGGHREVLPYIVEQCRNPKLSSGHRTKRDGRANLIKYLANFARTHGIAFDDSRASDLSEVVHILVKVSRVPFDPQMLVRDMVERYK